MEKAGKWKGEKVRNLSVGPCIKGQNWLKKIVRNKKCIPVSFKDQTIDSCAIQVAK
jgi:hypothetical protein